ncbi:MAG: citrate/2-methylcitrate synthase [Balneolales bacterium]
MSNTNSEIDLEKYPHLDKGLEGIVAFSSGKSLVDGTNGELIYAGYNIDELAKNSTFEEVCFLLWNERLPKAEELEELKNDLLNERTLPEPVLNYIRATDSNAEPMSVLRTATSMLADFDDEAAVNSPGANRRKSIRMTARMPVIIAAFNRKREGKDIMDPLNEGSTAYNFLYMLNGERPGENAEKVMDLCLILHAEHGMNASTFTCRAIGSTLSDIYSAVTGAIGSLKGPLHGGANTAVMNMLRELDKDIDIKEFIRGKLDRKEKVMGFGHRVYKTFDPRAHHLRKMSKSLAKEVNMEVLYVWSESILDVMKEEKNIDPNVDFFSATVYYSLGIQPDIYTCIFAMSRISGWTAHYLEQMEHNRLIRPLVLYTGEKNLPWPSIESR